MSTEEQSNEITAIPKLLEFLPLKGCIVAIDTTGCQQEIARRVLDRGADYVLAVKQNPGRLYQDLRTCSGKPRPQASRVCPMPTPSP